MAIEDDPALHAGEILLIGRAASVQFSGDQEILARVIRFMRTETARAPRGWCWLEVFQLNEKGEAVDVREVFVKPTGLHLVRLGPGQPLDADRHQVREIIRLLTH